VAQAYRPGNVLAVPEGDTIWRLAELLRGALVGKRVVTARPDSLRRFSGHTITEVTPAGKHLLIRFDNGLAIHSHMRMRGAWHVYRRGESWKRPAWQVKAVLETDDAIAVCFGAPVIDLVRDQQTKVGHLGPDMLADDWDAGEVLRRARARDAAPVGEVLLDQSVSAGAGNVYRCEAMWHERVNPWTPVRALDDDDLRRLFETARVAMRSNLGPSFERRFPGYGRGAVHGRAGRPCPRCGTRIQVRAQGEHARLTYWCPACQPPPKR
jgi:endonuclease VIII